MSGRTSIPRGPRERCPSTSTSPRTAPSPRRWGRSSTSRRTSAGTCARSTPTSWRRSTRAARSGRRERVSGRKPRGRTSTSPTAAGRGARRFSSSATGDASSSSRWASCARTCAGSRPRATSACIRRTRWPRCRSRRTTSPTCRRSRSRRSLSPCRACRSLGREPPGLVPDPALRRQAMAAYRASVSFADAQVGVLLDALDRLDLWKDTVVVLAGDNGFHLGEHGGLLRKDTLFEEALRVPLVVAAPGLVPEGAVARGPAEVLDVFPTVVELAGLPPVAGPRRPQPRAGARESRRGRPRGGRLLPAGPAPRARVLAADGHDALHPVARRQRGALRPPVAGRRRPRTSPPGPTARPTRRACARASRRSSRGRAGPWGPDRDRTG